MHADRYRWTMTFVAFAVLSTLGCRGSQPFGRFVQVIQEPESPFPEIEPPQQRLATAKPRAETTVTMTAQDDSPHVDSPHVDSAAPRSASASLSDASERNSTENALAELAQRRKAMRERVKAQANEAVAQVQDMAAPAQKQTQPRRPDPAADTADTPATSALAAKSKPRQTEPTAARATPGRPNANSTAMNPEPVDSDTMNPAAMSQAAMNPAAMDHSELMDAFSDYPPEVQREALRRLLAATSKTAQRTSQPSGLDSAIAGTMDDLPELPTASKERPEQQPARLATQAQFDMNQADDPAPTTKPEMGSIASEQPAAPETPTQSGVVQSISDSSMNQESPVKTASASRNPSDPPMVTRASLTPSDQKSVLESAASHSMDEKALYRSLVAKLSTAPDGESESARASRLIRLRHLMVLAGDVDSAVAEIEGMSEAEQEFLRHQLLGLWTMVDPEGHPIASRRITTALPQLREATKFAAAATDSLDVRSLSFCTEIESYGQIKPFPGNRFDAGQQVILYCEIENFTVEKSEDGFGTHLQGSYDIYNAENQKVVSQLLPADKQTSANYLRDYFIAYQMHLPAQLSAGTYRLQLTMEDVSGKKYGQASIPLEIAK